jgi:hypothetical protein
MLLLISGVEDHSIEPTVLNEQSPFGSRDNVDCVELLVNRDHNTVRSMCRSHSRERAASARWISHAKSNNGRNT